MDGTGSIWDLEGPQKAGLSHSCFSFSGSLHDYGLNVQPNIDEMMSIITFECFWHFFDNYLESLSMFVPCFHLSPQIKRFCPCHIVRHTNFIMVRSSTLQPCRQMASFWGPLGAIARHVQGQMSATQALSFIHGIPWMWLLRYDRYGIQPSSNPVLFHLDRQDIYTVKGAPWQIVGPSLLMLLGPLSDSLCQNSLPISSI